MIQSKQEYLSYLEADRKRIGALPGVRGFIFRTEKYYIWKFIRNLRRMEYRMNVRKGIWGELLYHIQSVRFYRLMHKTQLYIFPNVCGPGLYIPHLGYILISSEGVIGRNCTLRPGTLIASNLGTMNTKLRKVIVGDNVEFSAGCKVLCKRIGNNCSIGPNAVVTKNVPDDSIVMGNPGEIVPKVLM